MKFVNLRAETEFSITQGITRVNDLVNKAAKDEQWAVTLTDRNGLFGAIQFYETAQKKGIKPIIGIDVTIEQENGNTYQLVLLAKNKEGYKSITELASRAYTQNSKIIQDDLIEDIVENTPNNDEQNGDKVDSIGNPNLAAIKEEWLDQLHDVVILSGGKEGLIGQLILQGEIEEATNVASQMKEVFGEDFYLEFQRDGTDTETTYMEGIVSVAESTGISPVATHPNYFLNSDDFIYHETRSCIGKKELLYDTQRARVFNKDMYFKTQDEMVELFSDLPLALENTIKVAQKCNLKLDLNKPQLPNFPIPEGTNVNDYFAIEARKGLENRLLVDYPNPIERDAHRKEYEDRLEREISIIQNMGFPGYFLIVSDFINWSKEQDIPVGPGRGSGAGSLVAYAMNITDLDPIPYGLLFERFLNPDRVSMPDFDIDFCQERREEVIDYVRRKYGNDAVSQIGTFGTMAARNVLRGVGRTLNMHLDFINDVVKLVTIPAAQAHDISLKDFIFGNGLEEGEKGAILPDQKFNERYEDELQVRQLVDIAVELEGVTAQVGTHAAGVVIAPGKITDFAPLYVLNKNSAPATQFDKDDVEKAGLVKFDFLGLRNLTIIHEAVKLVEKNHNVKVDFKKVDLNDMDVYNNIFTKGNTVGIFQFEGSGMTAVLKKANPSSLMDLTAINALYRPGPMEIIPQWLQSKALPPEKRQYEHELLKPILKETYGFMIYQEQVMQCAQVIAGYSLGQADILRRAMGKKKPEEMKKQQANFLEGAAKNGIQAETAEKLFNLIDKFSGYGFNKSHAAAYSYLAYQTAYLKTYYPEEFFTANLNSNVLKLDTEKIAVLNEDAAKNKIKILSPDINKSEWNFSIESDGEIRYGLAAMKGVGNDAARKISKEREQNGDYKDFYDFIERTVTNGYVNKRTIEALVKAGAFDNLYSIEERSTLFASIPEALDYIKAYKKKTLANKSKLGNALNGLLATPKKTRKAKEEKELIRPELVSTQPWSDQESLVLEKSSIGYFFSKNPYKIYMNSFDVAKSPIITPITEIEEAYKRGEKEIFITCLVDDIKLWRSKKGGFIRITDGATSFEVSAFADFLTESKEWFKEDSFAGLKVRLQPSDEGGIRASIMQGFTFEDTKKLLAGTIFIGCKDEPEIREKIQEVLQKHKTNSTNRKYYATAKVILQKDGGFVSGGDVNVNTTPELFSELEAIIEPKLFKIRSKQYLEDVNFPYVEKKGNKPKIK